MDFGGEVELHDPLCHGRCVRPMMGFVLRSVGHSEPPSFNLTFPHEADTGRGWTSPYHVGINLGPVVLMRTTGRVLWKLMRGCPYIGTGLRRAGFTNGWL